MSPSHTHSEHDEFHDELVDKLVAEFPALHQPSDCLAVSRLMVDVTEARRVDAQSGSGAGSESRQLRSSASVTSTPYPLRISATRARV